MSMSCLDFILILLLTIISAAIKAVLMPMCRKRNYTRPIPPLIGLTGKCHASTVISNVVSAEMRDCLSASAVMELWIYTQMDSASKSMSQNVAHAVLIERPIYIHCVSKKTRH